MKVTRIDMVNGNKYFCEATRKNIKGFMKKHPPETVAKMIRLEMTQKEYFNIPAVFGVF